MALSGGSSKVFGSQSAFRIRVAWSATQNIGGNSSTVTAILYMESLLSWGSFNDATSSATSITINGNTKNFTANSTISGNQKNKELGRHTVTVGHNGDGTKTFSISASHLVDITYSGSFLGTQTTSGSYTLNTIPRTSSFSMNKSTVNYGQPVRITIKTASSGFTHTVRYDWNNNKGTIWSKINWTTGDWTVPMSFINYVTTATSSWGTVYVDTYSGNTLIGTTSARLTTTIPGGIDPTFSSITASETNSTVTSIIGAGNYAQSLSRIKFTINGASGVYGSTIKSYKIVFNGVTWNSQTATTGAVNKSGNITATGTVTDSRGRSSSKTVTINLQPYSPPAISSVGGVRNINGTGPKITVTRKGNISSLMGKNQYTVYVDYKEKSSATWTNDATVTVTGAVGATSINLSNILGPNFDVLKSYDLRINLHDKVTKATGLLTISSASVPMSWGKNGVGVGKIYEGKSTLEVGGSISAEEYMPQLISTGADLNAYTKVGFYYANTDAIARTVANAPEPNAFSLLVEKHAGCKQTFTTYFTGETRTFMRNYYNGAWGKWIQIGTKAHIPMMQDGLAWVTTVPNNMTGVDVKFLQPFRNTPRILVTAHSGANAFRTVAINNPTNTGFTIMVYRDTAVNTSVHWIAVEDTAYLP